MRCVFLNITVLSFIDEILISLSLESNAGCHDNLGLNMSLTVVQTDFDCKTFPSLSQEVRDIDKLSI